MKRRGKDDPAYRGSPVAIAGVVRYNQHGVRGRCPCHPRHADSVRRPRHRFIRIEARRAAVAGNDALHGSSPIADADRHRPGKHGSALLRPSRTANLQDRKLHLGTDRPVERRLFHNLCAIDARPAKASEPRIVSMFTLFAQLVALHLENERRRESAEAALLDERAVGELREQFIAVLGHDLRNPLGAVSACGQLLEKKSTDPALATIATRLMTNVRRMSALIDDTLDFARARLGSGIGVQIADVHDLERRGWPWQSELQDSNRDARSIAAFRSVARSAAIGAASSSSRRTCCRTRFGMVRARIRDIFSLTSTIPIS